MEQHDPTDADLVSQSLAGSHEAFACLFDRHARIVRAVVAGVSLDRSMIEDMTQDAFLRAFRNLRNLREPQRFGAWLIGIAQRVARERRRTLRRDRHEFSGRASEAVLAPADKEAELDQAEQIETLMQHLNAMPERDRLAIQMFYLQERNAQQAADLLELSRSGFYAVLKRALARLSVLLQSKDCAREAKR